MPAVRGYISGGDHVYAWWVYPLPSLSLLPDVSMLPRHKGFDIIFLHAEETPPRFRYEIFHRGRSLITSPTAYASEEEARMFVEGGDRLMGLGPPDRDQ